jgi:hypothetical protein
MIQVDTQERTRTLAGDGGDPERAWAARAGRAAGYFAPAIGLDGVRRVAAALVALLLRSS